MENKIKGSWWAIITALVTLCICGFAIYHYEQAYLWKLQDLNLFLNTSLFFKQNMVASGGLLTYLGSFFTQHLYHPALGVLLLCAWWAVLIWLIVKTFNLPPKWITLTFYPIALLLIINFDLGYWIYYMKLRGHFFLTTIGITAAVALLRTFRAIPSRYYLQPLFVVVTVMVGYPFLGFYALLAAALMAVISWRMQNNSRTQALIISVVALIAVIGIPLGYYRWVFYQTNIHNIYTTGIPIFYAEDYHHEYYIPYYLLVLYFVALAATYKEVHNTKLPKRWRYWCCQTAQMALMIVAVYHFWYKDYNFNKELVMQRHIENMEWQEVLDEASDLEDEPTRAIVMMKNLALFRLGRQGDEMYRYKNGAKESNAPFAVRLTQVAGRMLYYQYGKLNFCYRWCLEDGVEYGWRVQYLKYLTKCSLLNGEREVARKYINILKQTTYYSDWAAYYERFLNNMAAIKNDKEFAPITHMMGYKDVLDSDNTLVELYLLNQFAHSDSNDPLLQEQTLLCALQLKDIPLFWPRFSKYANLHPGKHMPIHYQEAAYLYGNLEHSVDISHMPFDKEVVDSYKEFMALAQQCAGMTEEQMKTVFYPRFGATFYYEYFLIRNQKSY